MFHGEVISAFNGGLRVLCAAGLRALIEGICADKQIHGRRLEEQIDGLDSLLHVDVVKRRRSRTEGTRHDDLRIVLQGTAEH